MSKSLSQIAERSTIAEVSASLGTDALIELFELDLGSVELYSPTTGARVNDVLRFHAGTNNMDSPIVWQGNIYDPFPVQMSGFEAVGTNQIPRPTMGVANITTSSTGTGWGFISNLTRDFDDLVGVKVTRKRTYARYLDSYCVLDDGGQAVGGFCQDTNYTNKADCEASTMGSSYWAPFTCIDCAAVGTWYVNNKSTFESGTDLNLYLRSSDTHQHTHKLNLTSTDICNLFNTESPFNKPVENNALSLASIDINSLSTSGTVEGFSIVGGAGYNTEDNLSLVSVLIPTINEGVDAGISAHIHELDLTGEQVYEILENPGTTYPVSTEVIEGHSHSVSIMYTAPINSEVANITIEFLDATDNHPNGTPHIIIYPTGVPPIFGTPVIDTTGGLANASLIFAGEGILLGQVATLLIPRPAIHSHLATLEYLHEGTDDPKLVEGGNSTFEEATTNWYYNIGTTITAAYDSLDTGYSNVLRIESGGTNNYAFIDIDTYAEKEYNISFNYKVIVGNTQKILVESDNGDGTWTTEFTENLTGTGWQTYSKTFFTTEFNEATARTRFEIFSSAATGGENDELLIDNFQVEQTWVRGDVITRGISGNHGHTLTPINKLVLDTSDSEAFFADDVFFIDRKVGETKVVIEFELAPAWDVEGIKLPKREIIQNTCLWKYRDGNCPYSGDRYFDKNDEPVKNTGSNEKDDVCAKKLKSCELRFAEKIYEDVIQSCTGTRDGSGNSWTWDGVGKTSCIALYEVGTCSNWPSAGAWDAVSEASCTALQDVSGAPATWISGAVATYYNELTALTPSPGTDYDEESCHNYHCSDTSYATQSACETEVCSDLDYTTQSACETEVCTVTINGLEETTADTQETCQGEWAAKGTWAAQGTWMWTEYFWNGTSCFKPKYDYKNTCEDAGYYWNSAEEFGCWDLNSAELPYGGFPGVGLGF
jgi:phage-related protein